MTTYKLTREKGTIPLAQKSAELIASYIKKVLTKKSRCLMSLAGGSTPQNTYSLLKEKNIPWEQVDILLGDERWVEPSSLSSNSLMINKTLLLDNLVSRASFYPVPIVGCNSPEESAYAYSQIIQKMSVDRAPKLDIALLGLGDDGHTASLFPFTDSLAVKDSLTTVSHGKGHSRVTMTASFLSTADHILFLVSGASKQTALSRLLDINESNIRTPAKLIQSSKPIEILADYEASSFIENL